MQDILYFDVCSLPIFLIILVAVYVRRLTKGITNRLFIVLILLSFTAALSDVISECFYAIPSLSGFDLFAANFFTSVYFLARNGSIMVYYFFMFAITSTWYRVRSKLMKFFMILPYAIICLIVALNPFTGIVFTITPEAGYERGPAIYILYAISTLYALAGTLYLTTCRGFLSVGKIVSLIALYVLTMGAVLVQYFFPGLLIEMVSTSFAMILVILFVLRPEELSDASVGSLSYQAYKNEIRKILMTGQKVRIAVISIINARELRSYLGEERYLSYVSDVIRSLDVMFRRERQIFNIYFEHPGTVYLIFDDPRYSVEDAYRRLVGELRRRLDDTALAGERIVAKTIDITIPDDLGNYDEIIKMGREFPSMMPANRSFSHAYDIVSSRDYKIISNIDTILNRAIAENKFRMYYQPIYSVEQDKFVSAEALIRLIDEEYGFISPGLFIPAAEKRGVILPIGDFVLEDVHRFISENELGKLGVEYIEINLSVAQCMQEELPEKLVFLGDKYGISPDRINLEITETTYEENGQVMEFNLEALSGMGYTFSLDDYGTGYSNMHRVSKLPLKIIKLDKSLVDDMVTEDGISIVRNTVKMMRDIDKELVAEGVERREELDSLKDMGCQFIQGYYFSKPLPEEDYVAFLKANNFKAAK